MLKTSKKYLINFYSNIDHIDKPLTFFDLACRHIVKNKIKERNTAVQIDKILYGKK